MSTESFTFHSPREQALGDVAGQGPDMGSERGGSHRGRHVDSKPGHGLQRGGQLHLGRLRATSMPCMRVTTLASAALVAGSHAVCRRVVSRRSAVRRGRDGVPVRSSEWRRPPLR